MRSTTAARRHVVRGEVDRDRRRAALGAPGGELRRRTPSSAYRVTSWMRPDCSASGMKTVGGSTPRVGCTQRMSASSPTVRPVVQLDLRLVVHRAARAARPARGQRAVQVAQQHQAGRRRVVLVGRVHRDARAVVLGGVHRDVRGAHERRRVGRVVGQARDADGRVDVQRQLAEHERRDEQAAHPAGQALGVGHRAHVGQQDRELVAAEARDDVVVPQRAAQPLGDLLEQLVAAVVAERVVDVLEPVDVEQHEADARAGLAAPRGSSGASARRACAGWAGR